MNLRMQKRNKAIGLDVNNEKWRKGAKEMRKREEG